MHLLENVGHSLLGAFLETLPLPLTSGYSCILVTRLKFLVRQEVLSHDTTDLFEVVKHL